MWDFCLILKSVGCREANASLGCMTSKMRLKFFFENEVEIFIQENKNNFHVQFYNEEFIVMLAYLADVLATSTK